MNDAAERFRRLGELFDEAATLDAGQRAAYLAALRGGDGALRGELEVMLAADSGHGLLDRGVQAMTAQVAEALEVPRERVIGNWRIVAVIGRGGMGAVWRAERADGAYAQAAALKLIQFGADSPDMRERFRRERQFLASLQHPNIATLLDGGVTADGTPYLAMEFVDGERIDAYCDAQRLSIAQRLKLMQQVLAAVQHAHQRLIVHRDLKPSNILVRADGTVKLLDFGIATVLDASGVAAATRDRPYTPGYAAPEQLAGEPVTTATDVHALGVILLRLLGGQEESTLAASDRSDRAGAARPPLPTAAAGPQAEAIAAARATTPRALRRTLRGDLDTIVQRALAAEPARRYPSAQALSADIDAWLAGRPSQARPDSRLYRTRMFVRRNRVAVAIAAAAVVALLGATVFSLDQARRTREAAQDAEARALSLRAVSDTFDHMFRAEHFLPDANGAASAASLLRENTSAIDYFLADQPLTHASLLWRTGRGLRLAGDLAGAVKTLRAATAAFAKAHADASLQGRDATIELARALVESGDAAGAAATLDALERSLGAAEVNVDLQRHAIAFLRARLALDAGDSDRAEQQIGAALALAPAPSGEHGARYGSTALLAGAVALAHGAIPTAADRFIAALAALTADPHTELSPPHQPLAPVIRALAQLGDPATAHEYATRWRDLRNQYFGSESPRAREAAALLRQLDEPFAGPPDPARAAQLRDALARYWDATFLNYDVTREEKPQSLDRDL